jgi:hypothetical protein
MMTAFKRFDMFGRGAFLGQCEATPDGGAVCADGKVHAPGCPGTAAALANAAPSGGEKSDLPVVFGVAAAGIAAYFLFFR